MINTLWGYYRTLNNVYFIRRRSVCETGRCCWWHGDDGGMMMKRSRRDVFLPLLNVKDTHCKSIGPWLQRLSLITSFRAEPGPMSLVWWWNVSFHIRANHKNVPAARTGDKIIVFKVSAFNYRTKPTLTLCCCSFHHTAGKQHLKGSSSGELWWRYFMHVRLLYFLHTWKCRCGVVISCFIL